VQHVSILSLRGNNGVDPVRIPSPVDEHEVASRKLVRYGNFEKRQHHTTDARDHNFQTNIAPIAAVATADTITQRRIVRMYPSICFSCSSVISASLGAHTTDAAAPLGLGFPVAYSG